MKKGIIYIILSLLLPLSLQAQESTSSYDVLKLPVSSHASALGGDNISNVEDRPDVGWSNPALLSGVTDYSVGFNFMTYGAGSKYLGFQGVKAVGQRHTVALMGQLMNYGEMKETDEQGNTLGTFNANDIILAVGYRWLVRATAVTTPSVWAWIWASTISMKNAISVHPSRCAIWGRNSKISTKGNRATYLLI